MEPHDRLAEQAAPYVIGALNAAERAEFEAHLATCASCAAEVRAFAPVAVGLARLAAPAEPSLEVRRRILDATRTASRGNVVVITKNRPAARSVLAPWLAAAAALAVAVALGAYAFQMRRAATQAEITTAVLEAPDLVQLPLKGQAPAPNASARAFVSRSRGVVLTAANVPALPPGRTYQVWVLTARTKPISIGLAKPDPTGRIAVTLPTDPSMPTPTGVAVTIEPEGGVPLATGPAYLIGTTP